MKGEIKALVRLVDKEVLKRKFYQTEKTFEEALVEMLKSEEFRKSKEEAQRAFAKSRLKVPKDVHLGVVNQVSKSLGILKEFREDETVALQKLYSRKFLIGRDKTAQRYLTPDLKRRLTIRLKTDGFSSITQFFVFITKLYLEGDIEVRKVIKREQKRVAKSRGTDVRIIESFHEKEEIKEKEVEEEINMKFGILEEGVEENIEDLFDFLDGDLEEIYNKIIE